MLCISHGAAIPIRDPQLLQLLSKRFAFAQLQLLASNMAPALILPPGALLHPKLLPGPKRHHGSAGLNAGMFVSRDVQPHTCIHAWGRLCNPKEPPPREELQMLAGPQRQGVTLPLGNLGAGQAPKDGEEPGLPDTPSQRDTGQQGLGHATKPGCTGAGLSLRL